MVPISDNQPSWEEFTKHEKRIVQLETKVAQLFQALAVKSGQKGPTPDPDKRTKNQQTVKKKLTSNFQRTDEEMSSALQYIVMLMRNGDMDGAFSEFQELPKSELIKQPVSAATLAAAICVARGEFEAGIAALEQVQKYTKDPRVEQIKQKLIKQATETET